MVLTELLEFDRSGSVEVDLPENEGDFVDVREHAEKHHSLDPVAVKFDHEASVGKSAEARVPAFSIQVLCPLSTCKCSSCIHTPSCVLHPFDISSRICTPS